MTIIEYLLKAIEEGKELTIIYHGGSKPGGTRKIIPRSAEGDTLKAVDTEYNRVKSFSIRKIEILNDQNEVIALEFDESQVEKAPQKLSIKEIYNTYKDTLEGFGWNVSCSQDFDDYGNNIEIISLFDSFKNGKPRSQPTAYLYQSESTHRPFGVSSVRMETRTYSNLDNALKLFLEEAKNCEIKNPKK